MHFPPRVFGALLLLAALPGLAGCAGPSDRRAIFNELDPAPMTQTAWARVAGTYAGPIHSSTERFGYEGLDTRSIRLDLSGSPYAPGVVMDDDNGESTAWTPYGERRGVFTNIPAKRYGAQGDVTASTHAPNQLLLKVRRFGGPAAPGGFWLIVTFHANGRADVDLIGHSGWRGEGDLVRTPPLATR